MKRKSYIQPSVRVVPMRNRIGIICTSFPSQSATSATSSEDDIEFYSTGLGDGYTDN